MAESRSVRLKRLRMRSWRRGMREMDLLLGPFADAELTGLEDPELAEYEALLEENDQELYRWVSGQSVPGATHADLVARIRRYHDIT